MADTRPVVAMARDPYTGKVIGAPDSTRHVSHPPSRSTDFNVRCTNPYLHRPTQKIRECGRLLAEMVTRPWRITCPKCKTTVESPPLPGEEGTLPPAHG